MVAELSEPLLLPLAREPLVKSSTQPVVNDCRVRNLRRPHAALPYSGSSSFVPWETGPALKVHRTLQPLRYLHYCSDCFRLSDCRAGLAPAGKRRLCTAHIQLGHCVAGWKGDWCPLALAAWWQNASFCALRKVQSRGGRNASARVYHDGRRCGGVASCDTRAITFATSRWFSEQRYS
jgi:hypothetical protein